MKDVDLRDFIQYIERNPRNLAGFRIHHTNGALAKGYKAHRKLRISSYPAFKAANLRETNKHIRNSTDKFNSHEHVTVGM
jgi:hypothetical protein